MIDKGRVDLLGIGIDVVDYDAAVARIITAASDRRAYGVTALAVHGVMTGVQDATHRVRLNALDLVVPDGQPVRWAVNAIHHVGLRTRVYGPELTIRVCHAAAAVGLPVYLFGSTPTTLERLTARLLKKVPNLVIAGSRPSRFRQLSRDEVDGLASEMRGSGARIAFVGLGCPRQEVFAYEMAGRLQMPTIAVGAAFDFHAGVLRQSPPLLQDLGLEWAFRLAVEPRRLWRRYVLLNPWYVALVLRQMLGGTAAPRRAAEIIPPELRFG